MSDESSPEDPAAHPELPQAPVVQPWNPQPWNPQPWGTAPAPDGWMAAAPTTAELGVEESPRRKRRWLRRALVGVVVLLVMTGLVGGSLAYVDHRQDVQHRKEVAARLAAEKKAEAAYVAAVKPLAIRVFDAAQPLQDVYDAYVHPKPGLTSARDDVIRHGGALPELKAVKLALSRLHPPTAHLTENTELVKSVDSLVSAFVLLERASHDKANAHGYIESFGWAFQAFELAENTWRIAVLPIDTTKTWPLPDEKRKTARGRNVPTASSFILQSDLACGRALDAIEFEDYKHPERVIRSTFPKFSKEIRALVTRLRAVKAPAARRPFQHRLEIGWSASMDVAKQFEALTAAYKRRDLTAYDRASKHLREAFEQMEDLGRAYTSQGVSACARFLGTGESKKGSSSTTA